MNKIPKLSELSIIQRNNIFSVLRVEITHHSNKIEGITLDYGETKKLLEDLMFWGVTVCISSKKSTRSF